jgi:hypothetical protein
MRRTTRWFVLPTCMALAGGSLALFSGATPAAASGANYDHLKKVQRHLLSGQAALELSASDPGNRPNALTPRNYTPKRKGAEGCQQRLNDNVKVNANCENITDPDLQGRGQSNNETSIAYNPNNPANMVASANDYRRGDGACYTSYTNDKGKSWQDSTVPFSFTRGQTAAADFGAPREYWGGGGDTSVAYDTKGNAYLSCQVFNRGKPTTSNPDVSSALLLFRSTGNGGASWNFPGRYTRASADPNNGKTQPFLDKQLMTVDNTVGSPYQDRVYVTWTEFAANGSAFIYEAYSGDYGETTSAPVLVSRNTPLCSQTFNAGTKATTGEVSNCNENQFSQPFTGKDGNLYVAYANFNNAASSGLRDDGGPGGAGPNAKTSQAAPKDNHNQILLSKSTDGGRTFSAPVKAADYYDLPDCATYENGQDLGRSCVPEKGNTNNSFFRATNYPSGAVSPKTGEVVVTIGSYINQHSKEANGCVPTGTDPNTGGDLYTGVKKRGACNNDILVSVSKNKGKTFTGSSTDPRKLTSVDQQRGQATTDQFFQWAAFTPKGVLAVSSFDRQYGNDENTGFSDISLSGSKDARNFDTSRTTSSSMPPPTQFAGVFYGDYTGLAAPGDAYPFWMDTRNPELFVCPGTATAAKAPGVCTASAPNAAVANDQDVFTTSQHIRTK